MAGFVIGALAQFTGQLTFSRDPALFPDLPLYILTSLATGLILWSMTLLWSFRRLLVFDHGPLYGYARKHTARAIYWQDIVPGSALSPVKVAGNGQPRRVPPGCPIQPCHRTPLAT